MAALSGLGLRPTDGTREKVRGSYGDCSYYRRRRGYMDAHTQQETTSNPPARCGSPRPAPPRSPYLAAPSQPTQPGFPLRLLRPDPELQRIRKESACTRHGHL